MGEDNEAGNRSKLGAIQGVGIAGMAPMALILIGEKERKGRKMIYKISDPTVLEFMEKVKKLSKMKC